MRDEIVWRRTFFLWCLPIVFFIILEHMIRTWEAYTVPIDIFAIFVVTLAWAGVAAGIGSTVLYSAYLIDLSIFLALFGGLWTIIFRSVHAGLNVLHELAFWAPVISVFWVTFHYRRPLLAVAFITVLYGSIFWGDWLEFDSHPLSEFLRRIFAYLAQAALLLALMKLFSTFSQREQSLKERLDLAVDHANRDPLTSLSNRRFFDEDLERSCERASRDGGRLSVVIADIDHFKSFNDDYGHSCGDDALKAVAGVIRERIRHADSASRWGGEEFAVILHNADLEHARQIAEELRLAVAAFPLKNGKRLSISLGVSEYRKGDTPESVFDRADRALFLAKSQGRNRVEVASG